MVAGRDPEGREAKHIIAAGRLAGRDVLEIGCGNGWLTRQYCGKVRRVTGIDPGFEDLLEAKSNPPGAQPSFTVQSMGEALPFRTAIFDAVVFSNSL